MAAKIGANYLEISVKDDLGVSEAWNLAMFRGLLYLAETQLPELRKAENDQKRQNRPKKLSLGEDGDILFRLSSGIWAFMI